MFMCQKTICPWNYIDFNGIRETRLNKSKRDKGVFRNLILAGSNPITFLVHMNESSIETWVLYGLTYIYLWLTFN